jgi:hypothetical protein
VAGVTGRQGMLAPPRHLVPPLIYSEVHVRPLSDLYFRIRLMSLITVRYFSHFMSNLPSKLESFIVSPNIKIMEAYRIYKAMLCMFSTEL